MAETTSPAPNSVYVKDGVRVIVAWVEPNGDVVFWRNREDEVFVQIWNLTTISREDWDEQIVGAVEETVWWQEQLRGVKR